MPKGSPLQLQSSENTVYVGGGVGLGDFRRVLAAIHNLTARQGHSDVVLDFSACEAAYAGPMLALCATVSRLRHNGADCTLRLPINTKLSSLFRNSNWAHLLSPNEFDQSTFRGFTQVPAINYSSSHEQSAAVNRMIDATLSSVTSLNRSDLAAVEWALSEITDNVLVHARSDTGGFVQLTNQSFRRRVELVVTDAGVGIPATLREGHSELRYDSDALEMAIREGVTRNSSIGQGNGLFGTFQVTRPGGGYFHIHAGMARLDHDHDQLRIRSEQIPFHGSLVVACIDFSDPTTLGEALKFGGRTYEGFDYINYRYDPDEVNEFRFLLRSEASSFGSRPAGQPVRIKLTNLLNMGPSARVVVDFEGIHIVSSSFADEAFGKLFVELGPISFMRSIQMINISGTIKALIDKAIMQRSRTGL